MIYHTAKYATVSPLPQSCDFAPVFISSARNVSEKSGDMKSDAAINSFLMLDPRLITLPWLDADTGGKSMKCKTTCSEGERLQDSRVVTVYSVSPSLVVLEGEPKDIDSTLGVQVVIKSAQ